MFTHGKSRKYEPFRYRYADIKCEYCVHHKNCGFVFCPAIMENLDDLIQYSDFITALENAEQCETPHKTALITIKKTYGGEFHRRA